MSSKMLEEKGFDYVALGHIHKTNYKTNTKNIYPSSTVALGFDEIGEHGMIVGEIKEKELKIEFVQLDQEKFIKKQIDITEILSKEELIEKINQLEIAENEYVEIVIEGKRKFEINKYDLLKYIENNRIIKIKDKTQIAYDLEKIANETTLKGLFVKEMLKRYNDEDITRRAKRNYRKSNRNRV